MVNFKDLGISHKVKVSCAQCLRNNHEDCSPLSPIKKITCQCAFSGHKNRGTNGKIETE